jgi:hypothetical protein
VPLELQVLDGVDTALAHKLVVGQSKDGRDPAAHSIVHVRVVDGGQRVVVVRVCRFRDEDVLDNGSVVQRGRRGRNTVVWNGMGRLQYRAAS